MGCLLKLYFLNATNVRHYFYIIKIYQLFTFIYFGKQKNRLIFVADYLQNSFAEDEETPRLSDMYV